MMFLNNLVTHNFAYYWIKLKNLSKNYSKFNQVGSKIGYTVDKILLKDKSEGPYGELNDEIFKYMNREREMLTTDHRHLDSEMFYVLELIAIRA